MILLYWPLLGAIHFLSAAAMGVMAVLSGKALRDMARRADRDAP